ncbi:MAG: 8-amino-7-oxononanoate synthase, partial [Desulfobacterales bacterium]|nr:8-amino-7-oxononanoate synthase [Desulfobacterales bacterium]
METHAHTSHYGKNTFRKRIVENRMMKRVAEYKADGLYPYYKSQTPTGLNSIRCQGRDLVQIGSSNYLGLAQDPRIREAVVGALKTYGTSCTSSRLLSGTRSLHLELEGELADFFGTEAALAFPTGYLANVGAIPALVGRHDLVAFDAEVHACLIDGMKLSGADGVRFRHNDVGDLEEKLSRSQAQRKMILIDSLYSMNGDLAPLDQIVPVADAQGAWVFLDDAHGIGAMGPGGRGVAHYYGLQDRIPVIMGVFSKSFASTGGFIAGSAELIEYLKFGARSFLYSNAIAPAQAAAALAALRILRSEPDRASRAVENGERARTFLRALGWRCGGDGTHMVSILIGDDDTTLKTARILEEEGVWVGPAVSPGVPMGKSLLRTCFPPTLSDEEFRL